MSKNATLTQDVEAIRPEARQRLIPVPLHVLDQAIAAEVETLKENFAVYSVPYNEDTVKAVVITHIYSAKASQEMFLAGPPPHIEQSPLSYAIHGGLLALNVFFTALDQFEEE